MHISTEFSSSKKGAKQLCNGVVIVRSRRLNVLSQNKLRARSFLFTSFFCFCVQAAAVSDIRLLEEISTNMPPQVFRCKNA